MFSDTETGQAVNDVMNRYEQKRDRKHLTETALAIASKEAAQEILRRVIAFIGAERSNLTGVEIAAVIYQKMRDLREL